MKFRVNLYPQELRPRYELITLSFVFCIWILAIGLVGGSWWYASDQLAQWQSLDSSQEQRLQAERTNLRNQAQLMHQEPSETLAQRVVELQKQVALRQQILSLLQKQHQPNGGYATLMLDLAKYHHEKVWLNRIRVVDDQLLLQGGTTEGSAVPDWLAQLAQSPNFQGQEFATIQLNRDEQDNLQFMLSSELANKEQHEAFSENQ
ncbi:PilN domain-containing protein [Bowmanella denitrificans]|uniref:PilN domain-containing protein n=1 Tax=Bowmanella denitrificans TaxID=366582 RepID=UPI000C9AE55F|nr:PilN domain-containing protein [Bowmanella denitrificans]